MSTLVSNATFDAALAAVPAPYGPLTRSGTSTNLETGTRPSINSDIRYHVKGAGGVDIYISHEEVSSATLRLPILREAYGTKTQLLDLKTFINALDGALDTLATPLLASDEDFRRVARLFSAMPALIAQLPFEAWHEVGKKDPLVAAYTQAVTNATKTAVFTNTSTGDVSAHIWSFGDGTFSTEISPTKVYGATGTFAVQLLVVGPRGISTNTTNVTLT